MDETTLAGQPEGSDGPPPPVGSSVPFEDGSQPFATRLLETVKQAFAEPLRLFSNMPADNIGPPVVYAVVIGAIGFAFMALWITMFGGVVSLVDNAGFEEFAIGSGSMLLLTIFSPVLVLVGLFVNAAIFHLMLMLVGGARRGFGVTLRSVAYGSTPQLLGVVPFCGSIVGGLWTMVLVILAAIHGHRTDAWRAILAYLLPFIFCCCLAIWLVSVLGFAGLFAR